ncbi:MAG: hypothetical protein ACHQ50_14275 [Fimbriimonadales bacterium]
MIAERPDVQEPQTVLAQPKKSRMLGALFGALLFLYALGHAGPGMAATSPNRTAFGVWSSTTGWLIAAGALVLAAYGLWGFPGLAKRWKGLAAIGALVSLIFLLGNTQWRMWPMMVADVAILSIAIDSSPMQLAKKKRNVLKLGALFLADLVAVALWLYGAAVIAVRPVYQNWGASDQEIAKKMTGGHAGTRANLMNHVVTVNAAPDKVWPWLVQIGQDKAGFYSYDWLERAAGARIRNVYQVRPEWQNLKAGDLIRACPPDWMGGRFGTQIGWHVTQIEPQRLMLLENWGPFWLEPGPGGKTRLGVRTEIGDVPFWGAPIEVFGFEPAHFIMEQKMLLTIKELAEKG